MCECEAKRLTEARMYTHTHTPTYTLQHGRHQMVQERVDAGARQAHGHAGQAADPTLAVVDIGAAGELLSEEVDDGHYLVFLPLVIERLHECLCVRVFMYVCMYVCVCERE